MHAWVPPGGDLAERRFSVPELRQVWQQAIEDRKPGVAVEDVLDRLERRYQAMADAAGAVK